MEVRLKHLVILLVMLGAMLFGMRFFIKRIHDISGLSPVTIEHIYKPQSVEELQAIIRAHQDKKISIAGGRYSQGGQIGIAGGIVIDITDLRSIISFDHNKKTVTVQAGSTWADIQRYIDPYNLSIQVMQSYNDFTVGGSLSVNVHGRDIHHGPIIESVESIKIVLADGSIIDANRQEHADLFNAAIGGYGLVGIVIQATLKLTENEPIKRSIALLNRDEYADFFYKEIVGNHNALLHNANLYPPDFQEVMSITWYKTDDPLTIANRLQLCNETYLKQRIEHTLLQRSFVVKGARTLVEKYRFNKPEVVWRNYEMSYCVKSIEPIVRFPMTTMLQEYFVPREKLYEFIQKMHTIKQRYGINVLNISIRYVPQNTESLLSYARHDSFALVFYLALYRTEQGKAKARQWTQSLMDAALSVGGTFYLPYQIYATKEQLLTAYPHFNEFVSLKKHYDPHELFQNSFWNTYVYDQEHNGSPFHFLERLIMVLIGFLFIYIFYRWIRRN